MSYFDLNKFKQKLILPYGLTIEDFQFTLDKISAVMDETNEVWMRHGLRSIEKTMAPANLTSNVSEIATETLSQRSKILVRNKKHNGHPDLLTAGEYSCDEVLAGKGFEIKATTVKNGRFVANVPHENHYGVFVYEMRNYRLLVTGIYVPYLTLDDFTKYKEDEGFGPDSKTSVNSHKCASPNRKGMNKLRQSCLYLDDHKDQSVYGIFEKAAT